MGSLFNFFNKYQPEISFFQEMLQLIIEHTKKNNTLKGIQTGISTIEGVITPTPPTANPPSS